MNVVVETLLYCLLSDDHHQLGGGYHCALSRGEK